MNTRRTKEPNTATATAAPTPELPTQQTAENNEIVDESVTTPVAPELPTTTTRTFTDVVFLMSLPEAKAVMEVHPQLTPEGFTGKRRAMPVQSGFNRKALKGHRVVAFNAMCNMVAEATEAHEVPIQMRVSDRNALVARATHPSATDEIKADVHNQLCEAMKKQLQIPVRIYLCTEETSMTAEVEEF